MTAFRLLCLWLLAAPATTATTPLAAEVSVDRNDPVVDRVMFSRNHLPEGMPKLFPGEAALTRSDYECRARVSYEIISPRLVGDRWHAAARIRHVEVETRLADTIYLPMMAPVLLRAHEEGHRAMNERIYQEGDAIAHSAAAEILSHDWEADGADAESAGKAATDLAVQHLCKVYLEATANRSSRLGDIYDRLTDHGRNQVYVANAIRLSFLEEQRQPATRPAELLRPAATDPK